MNGQGGLWVIREMGRALVEERARPTVDERYSAWLGFLARVYEMSFTILSRFGHSAIYFNKEINVTSVTASSIVLVGHT